MALSMMSGLKPTMGGSVLTKTPVAKAEPKTTNTFAGSAAKPSDLPSSGLGPTSAASQFEGISGDMLKPIFSEQDIDSKFGGRLRSSADSGANQAIANLSQSLGGDTDSPLFAFASSMIKSGAGVDATGKLNDIQFEAAGRNREAQLSGMQQLLQRLALENASRSIEVGDRNTNRSLDQNDLQIAQGDRRLDQSAAQIASSVRPGTETGGGIWDALGVTKPTSVTSYQNYGMNRVNMGNYKAGLN